MSSPSRTRRRRQLRETAACPDCSSHVQIVSADAAFPRVRIEHDDTCPWYGQNNSGNPFSQIRLLQWAP